MASKQPALAAPTEPLASLTGTAFLRHGFDETAEKRIAAMLGFVVVNAQNCHNASTMISMLSGLQVRFRVASRP